MCELKARDENEGSYIHSAGGWSTTTSGERMDIKGHKALEITTVEIVEELVLSFVDASA